jgi:hypothetical protein
MLDSVGAFVAHVFFARTQRQPNVLGYLRQYHADLRKWADEVLDAMNEAQYACCCRDTATPGAGGLPALRRRLMWKLSSLTDRGRFFFPSVENAHGPFRLPAFRGFRHEAVDQVVGAFRELLLHAGLAARRG